MIEMVSYPPELGDWNAKSSNFYLELYGETSPEVDLTYAETVPAGINPEDTKQNATVKTTATTPIYQYWWTIGQSGHADALELRKHLKDPAAHVYMYFPLTAGWRIKEMVATVKYLSPIKKDVDLAHKIAHVWDVSSPVLGGAGDLANLIGKFAPIPGIGFASPIFSAISRLKLNDVPPVDDFAWYVGKVTANWEGKTMQGVMWTLPKKIFTDIGGRITGSLAVSFVSSQPQQPGTVKAATDEPIFGQEAVRAHALIYADDRAVLPPDQGVAEHEQPAPTTDIIFPPDAFAGEPPEKTIHLPNHKGFIELYIQPRKP